MAWRMTPDPIETMRVHSMSGHEEGSVAPGEDGLIFAKAQR